MVKSRKFKQMILAGVAAVLVVMILLGQTGCTQSGSSQEILSQKIPLPGRTQITVLVKYAFSINGFEEVVEELFSDIDLVQVGNYTRDMGVAEYQSRIEHDDLTDIVMTWPLDVGKDFWADRLIDLSGMNFTSRYNISMLNTISQDGRLYYLPGPAQVRGIVYNKTLFEEKGWQVPTSYEGFISLCKTIEASGIRSLQLGFGNSEVLDTAFIGYSYGECFSSPEDLQWLADYNEGKGSFGDAMEPALDVFQNMITEGIWKPSDLDITYAKREEMFFTRQCAMVEDSVLLARMGYDRIGTTDEFALMPFFTPGTDDSDWARLYMVCYIGLNKHLEESQNKAKYEKVLKLMDFISTVDGQNALASDTQAMFSSLKDAPPPDVAEIDELIPALSKGRYAIFSQLKNASSAMRKGLAGMLQGTHTKEQVISMVDQENKNPIASDSAETVGKATMNFTILETGNFVTDALRDFSGCELALFMDNGKDGKYNGKGISGSLHQGDVTTSDINRILPDLKYEETGTLWKISMTGENLLKTLEHSIVVDNNRGGWFYYFSGLDMKFSPTAEPGKRIQRVTLSDGTAIDPKQVYTIAVMDESVLTEYIIDCEKTGIAIADILAKEIQKKSPISPSNDGRFQIAK